VCEVENLWKHYKEGCPDGDSPLVRGLGRPGKL
jgi:hypothetical protein